MHADEALPLLGVILILLGVAVVAVYIV